VNDNTEPKPNPRKREDCLSSNGKWRSFPKVPNLLHCVSNGNYYGRIKVGGKTIRERLKTAGVSTAAKLRRPDFVNKHQQHRGRFEVLHFKETVALFKQELDRDSRAKKRRYSGSEDLRTPA